MKKLFYIVGILLLAATGYYIGFESRIFGWDYLDRGLRYDFKLDILIVFFAILTAILLFNAVKEKQGKSFIIVAILLVIAAAPPGGFENNMPRVYNVKLFGAFPDGIETNDGSISSSSQTLTCTTCGFTAAAVGKYIIISGAGTTGAPLVTTISAFTNSTTVTLTLAAGTTVSSGGNVIWGTENTAAIQATVNASFNAGVGKVWFPNGNNGTGMYIIGAALTATTPVSAYPVNAQIYIPSNTVFGANSTGRTTVTLEGESAGSMYPAPGPLIVGKFATTGVILRSTISGSGILPAVIGFPNVTDGFQGVGSTDGIFRNLWIKVYTNQGALAPSMTAFNGNYASSVEIRHMAASIDVTPQSSLDPSAKEVCGFIVGRKNDNGPNIIEQCFASGFKYGFVVGEHTQIISLYAGANYYGLTLPAADYGTHGYALLAWNHIEVYAPSSGTNFLDNQNGVGQTDISLDIEIETLDSAARWYGGHLVPRIADSANNLHGFMRMNAEINGGAKDVPVQLVNATNLQINYQQDNSNWVGGNSMLGITSLGLRSPYSTTYANLGIGSLRFQSVSLNSGGVIGDNAHSSSGTFVYDSTGFAGWFQFFNGNVGWRPAVSGSAGASISIRTSFMLNNDLSFGIGGNSAYGTAAGYSLNGSTAGVLTPGATNTQDFGSSSLLWRDFYMRGIVGVITNSNAQTGSVGEYVTSLVAIGSPVSLSNGIAANITSISLTAGDWDVDGQVSFTETNSTVTGRSAGVTSTTATVPVDGSEAYCGVQSTVTSETNSISLVKKRFSLSGTTTVFLVGKASFSAGTCGGFGVITARRVR